jgi:long-chain acyl-CoA synthetase
MNERPWLRHYDKGVLPKLDYPDISVIDFLEKGAREHPHNPCTLFSGARISYGEMNALTDRLAAGFASLGIKKGDRVGLFMPNTPQFVMAYFALLKIGAIVVATNPLYKAPEIVYQVNDAGAEIMVLMTNNYEKIKALQPQTRIRQIVASNLKEALPPHLKMLFSLFREKKLGFRVELRDNDVWMKDLINDFSPEDRPRVDIGEDDIALLQYSGGTTGEPKGVIATHRVLVANTYQSVAWDPRVELDNEIVLMAIPLYHAYGMVIGMLYGLKIGASLVMVPDPRDIKNLLVTIQKYKPTIFPGVPAIYNAINHHPAASKYDLSSIKVCISGSAPLLSETKERFEALTGGVLTEGYGLSEAPVATHCNPLYGLNKTGSIGLPFPDVDCRIVELEDGVTVLGPGEEGELAISGPQVMPGYYGHPSLTMDAVRDGWLYTGDIAKMDEDGYFYIVGRKKELIKVGGFQVWPREVEEVILKHPAVVDVGVAGVPDAMSGEVVKAWVVLQEGEALSLDELRAWCRESLAAYKRPAQMEIMNELPKTNVGKVLRRKLVESHELAAS